MNRLPHNQLASGMGARPMDQSLLMSPSALEMQARLDKKRQFQEDFNGEHSARKLMDRIAKVDGNKVDKAALNAANHTGNIPSCIYLG